ncbi:transposase [Deinococcus sp. KNUC1210]|uniref:IS66 family transposase n=1 Tax=Deinococcus sp. KNUC1210 TaxID=2917691 RepID=UPI00351CC5B4
MPGCGIRHQCPDQRAPEPLPLQGTVNERLRKGLLKHHQRGSLLRFLDNPSIPPTNNAAERDLRSGVSARKVSQCSKTQQAANSYALIKSLVETAKRHSQHPLTVLVGLQVRATPH